MATTDLGRVCPVLMGAYATGTEYSKLDIVTYGGGSYICKTTSTGNVPTNTTYWQLLAEAGDYAGTAEAMVGINLLHNWDMRTPVNQRAVSGAYSTAGYFFDRWLLNSGTVTPATGYLTLANATVIEQKIEGNSLAGKEVTVSVMIGGSVLSGTGTFPTSAGTVDVTIIDFGTATLGYATGYMFVRFTASAARNIEILKVELGTVSTLNRQPPIDTASELLKCLRYYQNNFANSGNAVYSSSSEIQILVRYSGLMRAAPSIVFSTLSDTVVCPNVGLYTPTSITVLTNTNAYALLKFEGTFADSNYGAMLASYAMSADADL